MKTMKDFAAQQLSKRQMNEVRGGHRCFVVTRWGAGDEPNEGYWIEMPGSSASEVVDFVPQLDGAVGFVC